MPARVIAIGDIHGCSAALAVLVEAINPTSDDILIPLGDYLDRGLDSCGVLEQLIALADRCQLVPILGNHEEMLLAARTDAWALKFWLACGGVATLASYGDDTTLRAIPERHWEFLHTCVPFHDTTTHVFAHARSNFRLPPEPEDGRPLWPRFSGKTGIIGHDAQKNGEIRDEDCLKCIDTFCHGGGWLTALEAHTGQVWQANERGLLRSVTASRRDAKAWQ
jgi:serine/threonine protein phosphatase 1